MGAVKLFGGHKYYSPNITDPNPINFVIKKSKSYVSWWVSLINYPDAKNYECNKILITTWDPNTRSTIDPHFDKHAGIIARFEPTDEGWKLANKFAKIILNSSY